MVDGSATTPKFDSPPVVETAISVEFRPLERWGIPHFGLFWHRIRRNFPQYSVQTPLGSEIETFDSPQLAAPPRIQLLDAPEVRCWFFDSEGDQLVQVQRDRFVYNWRLTADHPYPSYEKLIPRFTGYWEGFCEFLRDEELGPAEVVQCELTYVNHLEKGREWQSTSDLPKVLSPWSGEWSGNFLPVPERVQVSATFLMPNEKGRLRVGLQPVLRTTDRKELWQLNLIARGAPESTDRDAILAWLDLGHEWIVRGFTDLTSPEMHRLWKRRS